MFKPTQIYETKIIESFYIHIKYWGVQLDISSLYWDAYSKYIHDFYEKLDYSVNYISIKDGVVYVDYYNNRAECYDGDTAPLWTKAECVYYTMQSLGLASKVEHLRKYLFMNDNNRRPWQFYWSKEQEGKNE